MESHSALIEDMRIEKPFYPQESGFVSQLFKEEEE